MNKLFEVLEKRPDLPPFCYVQLKGTEICMDVQCECGTLGHVDGEFCFAVKCKDCGRIYALVPFIDLVPIAESDLKDFAGAPYEFSDE